MQSIRSEYALGALHTRPVATLTIDAIQAEANLVDQPQKRESQREQINPASTPRIGALVWLAPENPAERHLAR
jgi:hypothetical protein